MCLIVFPPPALFPFFIFLCSEIFVGGILTSIESVIRKSFSAALLPLPVIVLALTAEAVFTVLQRRTARSMQTICVEAKVKTGEKEATLTLMVDSGNFAFEQTSGKRIIFIGRKAANRLDFSSLGKFYPVSVRSATGKTVLNAYVPDKIKFDRENYAKEDFLLLPDPHCDDFCGFDGIIPIVR